MQSEQDVCKDEQVLDDCSSAAGSGRVQGLDEERLMSEKDVMRSGGSNDVTADRKRSGQTGNREAAVTVERHLQVRSGTEPEPRLFVFSG